MQRLAVLFACSVLLLAPVVSSANLGTAQSKTPIISTRTLVHAAEPESVSNASAPDPESSAAWKQKIDYLRSRGVLVRAWDFASEQQLGTLRQGNVGITPGSPPGTVPELDRTIAGHNGGGSLKFTVKGRSGPNTSGLWYANFSSDLKTRFSANSEFWVQWKERRNAAMINEVVRQRDGSTIGIKTLMVGHQDGPGAGTTGTSVAASSEDMKIVINSMGSHKPELRFPNAYRYSPVNGMTAPFFAQQRGQYWLQPGYGGMPGTCKYPGPYAAPNCFQWGWDVWETYTLRVKLGPYNDTLYRRPVFEESEIQLYVARPGQARKLIVDWRPSTPGYVPLQARPNWQYGKLWFGPYLTNKDSKQDHADMIVWIADVIVSTEDPDKLASSPAASPGPLPAGHGGASHGGRSALSISD